MSSSPVTVASPFVLNASAVARAHTALAYTAFTAALLIGSALHYKKIVKNGVAAYPQEWFPSVSATIGDWYPERNIFQILIALTAGPRLLLVALQYYLHTAPGATLPFAVFLSGIVRTLSCGGWVYITSSDDHDVHDVCMIAYMLCNIPWMLGGIVCTPLSRRDVRNRRTYIATAFFVCIVPLVYFFIQHKVHRIPGAYTYYSFFEWSLIFFDVLYDSVCEQEFRQANVQITVRTAGTRTHTEIVLEKETVVQHLKDITAVEGVTSNGSSHSTSQVPQENTWRPALGLISDVYLSYVSISTITSLIPTLFYFSVWELGIAGHELTLLVTLSPFLLTLSGVSGPRTQLHGVLRGKIVMLAMNVVGMAGMAAYVLDGPGRRLAVVAVASGVTVLRWAVEWSTVGEGEIEYRGLVFALGLLVSSLAKHANHSNNPVWSFIPPRSGGYNKSGLVFAFFALCELYTRPVASTLIPGPKLKSTAPTSASKGKATKRGGEQHDVLPAALALGSLIFILHNHLSDAGTLPAWSWTGYANGAPKGPVPHLHAGVTLVVQCLGLLFPVALTRVASADHAGWSAAFTHPLWFTYGAAGAYVMYAYRDWTGYIGGLNYAVFAMAIIPGVFQQAAAVATTGGNGNGRAGKVYGTAWLVWIMLNLASVFTVAYAFVPGGVYLRERTDLVLVVQMICLSFSFRLPTSPVRQSLPLTLPRRATAAAAAALLACISIATLAVSMYRWPVHARPAQPGHRVFNAGIWTLHFGIDNEGRDSQRGLRDLVRDMKLDVVGLLETDLQRTAFGHRDLTRLVAEELGYYVDTGPGPNAHTWGAVLLSKFPIINSTHHLLPSPGGELAPAIEAVLDIYGTEVTVVVAHNGQEEDPLDRELQSTELARIMAATYPRPVFFLGYVVTHPKAQRPAPYEILVTDGRVHDIDQDDNDRWCEYILYRGLYRTSYARVSRGIITDTEMQIGQFVLPRHGTNVIDDSEDARYMRAFKEEMPEDYWFPMAYFEQHGGVSGHFYHVFGTPLYYKLPEGALI